MKYIIVILLTSISSYFLTKSFLKGPKKNIQSSKTICPKIEVKASYEEKTKPKEVQSLSQKPISFKTSKCLTYIKNKGDSFKDSEISAENKIYELFADDLKNKYDRPNEENVVTNDADFGSSAQEYDPREYQYKRFKILDESDVLEKKSFILNSKKYLQINSPCLSPSFQKIKTLEDTDKIVEILRDKRFREHKNFELTLSLGPKDDILLNVGRPIVKVSIWSNNYKIYFQNSCSGGLSFFNNVCILNPSYDMQFHDVFYIEDKKSFRVKSYCKKSNETNWTKLSESILE